VEGMQESEAETLTKEVKELAINSGANLVGIVSAATIDALPAVWVGWTIREYTKKTVDVMPESKSIVVIGYHVWDNMLELAIKKGERWIYPGYFPLTIIALRVTQFLEAKGFKAVSFFSCSYKRLAHLAGFGNYGKNALIINPTYGPWIRLAPILTDAEMTPDKPFETDLCVTCDQCVKACPVNALKPYKVDDTKCLVGIQLAGVETSKYEDMLKRFQPAMSKHSHLMCIECQKTCKYGKREPQTFAPSRTL
jgi:ferredoxin